MATIFTPPNGANRPWTWGKFPSLLRRGSPPFDAAVPLLLFHPWFVPPCAPKIPRQSMALPLGQEGGLLILEQNQDGLEFLRPESYVPPRTYSHSDKKTH